MEEDLKNLIENKSKSSILDSLREAHAFEVPNAMIDSEVNNMRQDAARRVGMDPKDMNEDIFPKQTFEEEAKKSEEGKEGKSEYGEYEYNKWMESQWVN